MGRSEDTAGKGFRSGEESVFENVASNTRWSNRSNKPRGVVLNLSQLLLNKKEQPGSVSHPLDLSL